MISSLYASLLAVIFLILTIKVVKIRKSAKVSIGDAGNLALQKAIRAQGNFCESTPIAVILLILAEASMASSLILHFCGIIFVLGRIFHAIAINSEKEDFRFRVGGMVLSLTSIILLILLNLFFYFSSFSGA